MNVPSQKRFIDKRAVGRRYGGRHPRTVDRWVKGKVIPPPDQVINDRPYWDEDNLDAHDRQRTIDRAKALAIPE